MTFQTTLLELECPQCNRRNEPTYFEYDYKGNGTTSRRYFYCCPDCKIHYTDWGSDADWKPGRLRIHKRCKQNGDHRRERLEFQKALESEGAYYVNTKMQFTWKRIKLWFQGPSCPCDGCWHSSGDCLICPYTETINRLEKWTTIAEKGKHIHEMITPEKVQFT